ncbi:MAG: diadenylate cyclase CdaA [Lentisphaeria bacterium]|nr:diadenylate cyclase CdaA [Lentisphaeria bacterium]
MTLLHDAFLILIEFGKFVVDPLRNAAEVVILFSLIYYILLFLKGTRSATVLTGFALTALFLTILSNLFGFEVLKWVLSRLWGVAAMLILIIFQPEIRRVFADVGRGPALFINSPRKERQLLDAIINSVFFLADHRIGALIAFQRDVGMRAIAESGTVINAPLSQELLTTFFFPNTPLHDGGVLIKDDMILAAGCLFPLTQNTEMCKSLGTRHRAGVGLSEDTDALVVIVSEETGAVSLAYKGRLLRGLSRERLERHFQQHLIKRQKEKREQLRGQFDGEGAKGI